MRYVLWFLIAALPSFTTGCKLQLIRDNLEGLASGTPAQLGGTLTGSATNIVFSSTADQTFTLTNTNPSTVTSISLATPAVPFSIASTTCTGTLAPGASCTYTIRFSSPGASSFSDTLSLSYFDGNQTRTLSQPISATGIAMSATVSELYAAAKKWNKYIAMDTAADVYHQAGNPCAYTALAGSYASCVHGGEKRIATAAATSCVGLTLQDTLGVFDWICDSSSGSVKFYSSGLRQGKGLKDLIDASGWLQIRFRAMNGPYVAIESPQANNWWGNTVVQLDGSSFDNRGPTDSLVNLPGADMIYVVGSSRATGGYALKGNGTALIVVGLGNRLIYNGHAGTDCNPAGIPARCVVWMGSGNSYQWLEGQIDSQPGAGTSADYGVSMDYTNFSVLNLVYSSNSASRALYYEDFGQGYGHNLFRDSSFSFSGNEGMYINGSGYNNLLRVEARANGLSGIRFQLSPSNIVANSETYENFASGVTMDAGSAPGFFYQHHAWKNAVDGLTLAGFSAVFGAEVASNGGSGISAPNSDLLVAVTAANNTGSGIYTNGVNQTVIGAITLNNGDSGISSNSTGSTFSHITAINNAVRGFYLNTAGASNNTYSQLLASNNNTGISVFTAGSTGNKFSQIAIGNNATGISLASTGNTFVDNLLVGTSNTTRCNVTSGTGGLINGTCSDSGTDGPPSNYTGQVGTTARFRTTGLDMSNTFAWHVTTDDATNQSDFYLGSYGVQAFNSLTDWTHFESIFRGWGSSVVGSVYRGTCNSGTICLMWDTSLKMGDTAVLNRSGDGVSANTPFAPAPTFCPSAVHGNFAIQDQQSSPHTYLVNAVEIPFDGIGNDNGLCESGEACIYSPNFGGYQGSGPLVGPCRFQDGIVSGVTIYAYSNNGI